jgi:hypothetical protein
MKKIGLTKLMNSSKGKIIFSIILGFGIATLFRKVCKDRNCIVFKAPELNNIVNKTFKFDNKCYKYNEKNVTCNKSKQILEI